MPKRFALFSALSIFPVITMADAQLDFGAPDSEVVQTSILIDSDTGRVVISSSESKLLYNPEDNSMTAIDDSRQRYIVIDRATAERANTQIAQAMKDLEDQLASLPPEQQEMARRMMEQQMPGFGEQSAPQEISFQRLNETAEYSGVGCTMVTINVNGEPKQMACVAEPDELGISAVDHEALASAFDAMRDISNTMTAGVVGEFSIDMRKLEGFPIYTRSIDKDDESRLLNHSTDSLDDSLVQIPPSYKKEEVGF